MKRILFLLMLSGFAATAMAGNYNFLEPEEFRFWLEIGKEMAVVDIQAPDDFRKHHFEGSLETNAYPVQTADDRKKLDKVVPLLSGDRNDVVVISPRGGGGAKKACDYLKEKGVEEKGIFILEDGMQGWPYKDLTVTGK